MLGHLDQPRATLAEKTMLSVFITENIHGQGYFRHLGQQTLGRLFRLRVEIAQSVAECGGRGGC